MATLNAGPFTALALLARCLLKLGLDPPISARRCSMHGGHVIFVISGSSFRWVCSSIPDPKTHASLAAIPIFVLVVAAGGRRCARARKGDRAGSCQMTGAVEVRESRPANP